MIPAIFRLTAAAVFLALATTTPAEAGCRNTKPICGNPNICHSDERSTNKRDLDQPIHPTLCGVLNKMEKKFGKIGILAAYRADNAARGGARGSVHLKKAGGPSYAVDIRVSGTRRNVYQALGEQKCKGIRYNIYCATGTVHVDVSSLGDNYSGCSGFFRPRCESGDGNTPTPTPAPGDGYRSPAVEDYKKQRRTDRPRCWNAKKWGSCCGPARKRNGFCSG